MKKIIYIHVIFTAIFLAEIAHAQISLPPSGDNQKCSVTQWMGLTNVTITWNSPNVMSPTGEDRKGRIWGELVPYGFANLGFGYSTDKNPSPWRAGSNENTTITFSNDVTVEGKKLKAGTYGFFIAPAEGDKPWTLIFSNNSTAWGSFFYKPEDEALRVEVKPQPCEYNEWLTYEFTDRQLSTCTAQLKWENLKIPFKISVDNMNEMYFTKIKQELENNTGFDYNQWVSGANYCVQNKFHLGEALAWANYALDASNGIGRKDFNTLSCKANVLSAMGKNAQGDSIMKIAINDPTASALDVHFYARNLQQQGKVKEALDIFKLNYQKYPNDVVTSLGLARGYSASGDYKNALKYAKSALAMNPNAQIKQTLEDAVKKLEQNQDFN